MAGWSLMKQNAAGKSVFRNKYKYGLPAAGAAWFMLDKNAGNKVGGLFGNLTQNVSDGISQSLMSIFMQPSSISLSVLLSFLLIAGFGGFMAFKM